MTVTFVGFNTHPGYAKGRMLNAIRVASDFVASLPQHELAEAAAARHPGASVAWSVEESYRNMREVLENHASVVEYAREAMRRVGIAPVERPIRGGADGSRLSFMGLPTPNLFAGEHNFHSRLEWVSAQDMDKAADVIVRLANVWEEKKL